MSIQHYLQISEPVKGWTNILLEAIDAVFIDAALIIPKTSGLDFELVDRRTSLSGNGCNKICLLVWAHILNPLTDVIPMKRT